MMIAAFKIAGELVCQGPGMMAADRNPVNRTV